MTVRPQPRPSRWKPRPCPCGCGNLGLCDPHKRRLHAMPGLPPGLEDALRARYRGRPADLEQILANAWAWERLKAISAAPSGEEGE